MERLINCKVEPGRLAIHWLGQAGFAFKPQGGEVVVVDPYLSNTAETPRLLDVPIRPKDVKLDYLFLTHDHWDHTDPHTAPAIAQTNAQAPVICPPSSCRHLLKLGVPATQITTATPGQRLGFPGFSVHVAAAQHTEDSVGYVFEFSSAGSEADSISIYLTGDTEYHHGLAAAVEEFSPEVLLVPISGQENSLDAAQAARLAAEIGPREVIPMHYGLFAEDPADPADFVAHLAAGAGASVAPVVMKYNTCHLYCPAEAAQGKHAKSEARSARARAARVSHQHHDGLRGPNGGSGITRGGGRAR